MIKCDWCQYSRQNKDGKLVCPYSICHLSQKEIIQLIMTINKTLGGNNERII